MSAPRFVWYDLMSSSPSAAESFYGSLLGWTTQSWTPPGPPGEAKPYTMLCVGGAPFGGLNELPQGVPAPSHWYAHVAIPDLDAAVERAKAAGGSFPAGIIDVPTVGRMAPMLDPQGAFCSLFTPASAEGMTPVPGTIEGMVGWNELMTADVDAAQAFYGSVVGWSTDASPMGDDMTYYLFGGASDPSAGMMETPPNAPTAWFLYFTVGDIDAKSAAVTELGGQVIHRMDVPTVGRLAVCAAPDGSHFGLAQWEMPPAT